MSELIGNSLRALNSSPNDLAIDEGNVYYLSNRTICNVDRVLQSLFILM